MRKSSLRFNQKVINFIVLSVEKFSFPLIDHLFADFPQVPSGVSPREIGVLHRTDVHAKGTVEIEIRAEMKQRIFTLQTLSKSVNLFYFIKICTKQTNKKLSWSTNGQKYVQKALEMRW